MIYSSINTEWKIRKNQEIPLITGFIDAVEQPAVMIEKIETRKRSAKGDIKRISP